MKRAVLLVSLPLLGACSSVDPTAYSPPVKGPAFGAQGADFRPVSAVVERRCGTLDCHGSIARPLRIYGQYGLRRPDDIKDDPKVDALCGFPPDAGTPVAIDAGYYPGGLTPTTPEELCYNYQSMGGLEPELFDLVVAKKDQPEALTLVRKPRLLEKHKGGLVWNKGDTGDKCVINWLTGVHDTTPCANELMHP